MPTTTPHSSGQMSVLSWRWRSSSLKPYEGLGDLMAHSTMPASCATPLHELTGAQWERAVRIDLTGVFFCMKHEIRAMLKTGGGAIVNTASALGAVAIPNASEYVSAKHGVVGLTRAAAVECGAHRIRVNA